MAEKEEGKKGAELKQSKKKHDKKAFPYGNYSSYYGYRIGQNLEEDSRLKVLKKEWFEGKDCLDIGCNNGIVTIQIARKYNCRSILGIDIDSGSPRKFLSLFHVVHAIYCQQLHGKLYALRSYRVDDAYRNLRKASRLDVAEIQNGTKLSATGVSKADAEDITISSSKELDLRTIVSFRQQNFIASHYPYEKHYDTILCLSVTKWVHLNWGDEGLITLFSKIWRLLRPGGMFVLEPQPWKSYETNYRVSETAAKNFRTIKLHPDKFQDILLDKIGFRTVEDLTSSMSCSNTGFNRPIFVFQK